MNLINPDFLAVCLASLCGAGTGLAIQLSRSLGRTRESAGARTVYVIAGTLATWGSTVCFVWRFGYDALLVAVVVTILIAAWIALLNTRLRLRLPSSLREVRPAEFRVLQSPILGLGLFGWLVRKTPLGKLGGDVFLQGRRRRLSLVLEGLLDAEAVHFWAAVVTLPFLLAWLFRGAGLAGAVSGLVVIHLHLIPLAHVRMARYRLGRSGLVRRQAGRTNPSSA